MQAENRYEPLPCSRSLGALLAGHETKNGVLSELPPDGEREGAALKTILEYAEEDGLSTGVISNSPMYDATPAACYAHAGSRQKHGQIFAQIWQPRFGDGVDLVFGPGRREIIDSTRGVRHRPCPRTAGERILVRGFHAGNTTRNETRRSPDG